MKSTLAIDVDGRNEELQLVGTSLRGRVYRSARPGWWYRLIPMDEIPPDWKENLHRHSITVTDDLTIGPVRDWRQTVNGVPHLIVLYRHNIAGRTMSECLTDASAERRVECASAALRALTSWWQQLHRPLLPMPGDIVLGEDGRVRLLWVPAGVLPTSQNVIADPQRVLYLSPELVRSAANVPWDQSTWEAIDRYSVGVSVLQCYQLLPKTGRLETAMFRGANASLLDRLQPRSDTPPWVERFSTHGNTLSLVQRLTSTKVETRQSVHLGQLADRLDQHVQLFDARRAIEQLRDSAKPAEAVELLQEVFPLIDSLSISVDVHYDLLRLAADLCEKYLRRPLDALDFYDRANELDAASNAAARDQMRMIANARHHPAVASLVETNPSMAEEIHAKLWRNYMLLANGRTHHATEAEGELDDQLVARYLLWRGAYVEARDFVFPRLSDAAGKYLWWDFDLNLAYVEAFIELESGDGSNATRAVEQLQIVRNGLRFSRQNGTLHETTAASYGQKVSEFERRLYAMGYQTSDSGNQN